MVAQSPDALHRIGENMRRIRVAAGLVQEDVARAAEIPTGSLSDYERGETEPRATTLFKIAWAMGISVDALFEGVSVESVPGFAPDLRADEYRVRRLADQDRKRTARRRSRK